MINFFFLSNGLDFTDKKMTVYLGKGGENEG